MRNDIICEQTPHQLTRPSSSKNGHLTKSPSPRRYCNSVKPTLPEPMKTTVVASQISKLCM